MKKKAVLIVVAVATLTACVPPRVVEFSKERIENYCKNTTPITRDALRSQLVHPDGSPMIVVYCEPHGGAQ